MHANVRSLFAIFNALPGRLRRWADLAPATPTRRTIQIRLKKPTAHAIHRALCRVAGADDMKVSGAFGAIEGSIDDYAILETYARSRTWCPVENDFFATFFAARGGGTYLDIGANIGLTTIPVARNPHVSCLAFEPEPANFRYLRRNVNANCRNGNVELFSLALFDRRTRLEFQLSPSNKGDHRVRSAAAEGDFAEQAWPVIGVDAERLDQVLRGRPLAVPLAAKIIAQGAEPHIVAGGAETLGRAEALVIEIYPYALRRMGGDVEALLRFLGRQFREAAMIAGGTATAPVWHPAAAVVDALAELCAKSATSSAEYFHVFLRA
jgi:FkbM family methyltransferase